MLPSRSLCPAPLILSTRLQTCISEHLQHPRLAARVGTRGLAAGTLHSAPLVPGLGPCPWPSLTGQGEWPLGQAVFWEQAVSWPGEQPELEALQGLPGAPEASPGAVGTRLLQTSRGGLEVTG